MMLNQSMLNNGIRIISKQMPSVRSFSIGFLFDASPAHEATEKNGVAHLTEHLMFKGTRNRQGEEIARLMDSTGGSMGGFTTRDYTCYSATVLDDYRTYVIDVMGDMFINSLYEEESVAREKDSIGYELAEAADRPDILAHENLKEHIWLGHPLGRSIGGRIADVKRLTRQDVKDFAENCYAGNRLIIAAAGNLQHSDLVENINDVMWSMKAGDRGFTVPAPPVFRPGGVVAHQNVGQTYFSIGVHAAPYADRYRYHIHLLTTIFGGGVSSRLFYQLRQRLGLVYDVGAEYQAYRDDGLIVIEGATTPELLERVVFLIFEELEGIATGEKAITEEELWIAKMQLKGQQLLASESSQSCMSSLLTQVFYFGRYIPPDEIVEQIDAITVEDLNKVAQEVVKQGMALAAMSFAGAGESEGHNEQILQKIYHRYDIRSM
ncbi:M16 family metallopeptidase [Desulfogranum japonicum]|uniref:M16 family metallopeptidase n=1 Tax=Desulfogranum japonicum TaxID=231447 RepID=UPI00040C74B1|nr:pitrilysin family protein [Desulfogranum japonicum]